MKDKIIAVIVTYYPDRKLLISNVESLMTVVEKIIIWENTPCEQSVDYRFLSGPQVEYMGLGKNVGISKALNSVYCYAKENGYQYLLTMDQDSCLDNLEAYLYSALKLETNTPCIIGPLVNNEIHLLDGQDLYQRHHIITSGAIVPLKILDKINGYNEAFFVDAIDVDLSVRAANADYPTFVLTKGRLIQRYGEQKSKIIFGHTIRAYNYSVFRLYGIFRNHTIIFKQNKYSLAILKILLIYLYAFVPGILFIEENKYKKIKTIIKGIVDGIKYKI